MTAWLSSMRVGPLMGGSWPHSLWAPQITITCIGSSNTNNTLKYFSSNSTWPTEQLTRTHIYLPLSARYALTTMVSKWCCLVEIIASILFAWIPDLNNGYFMRLDLRWHRTNLIDDGHSFLLKSLEFQLSIEIGCTFGLLLKSGWSSLEVMTPSPKCNVIMVGVKRLTWFSSLILSDNL